jgi:F-type H+-transporting ATPase subunit epsilon
MALPAAVVTPERILLQTEATEVHLRTEEGEAAFLPGHTPLIGALTSCLVRVVGAEGEQRLAVHGGFVHVEQAGLVILAPVAERAEEIDVPRAQQARERAEARLAELRSAEAADEEIAALEADLARARLRLEVASGGGTPVS